MNSRIELNRVDGEVVWVSPEHIGPILTGKRRESKGAPFTPMVTVMLLPGGTPLQVTETLKELQSKISQAIGRPFHVITEAVDQP